MRFGGHSLAAAREAVLNNALCAACFLTLLRVQPVAAFKPRDEEPFAPNNPRGLQGKMGQVIPLSRDSVSPPFPLTPSPSPYPSLPLHRPTPRFPLFYPSPPTTQPCRPLPFPPQSSPSQPILSPPIPLPFA